MLEHEFDLGTATAAEMGTASDVSLGTAQQSELPRRERRREASGVSLEIYTAKQRRLLELRKQAKAKADEAKEVNKEIAAIEDWLLETMGNLAKDSDKIDGHTISVTRSLQASIAAADRDEVVPLLQGMGWTKAIGVTASSLSSLIREKIAEVVDDGGFLFEELADSHELSDAVLQTELERRQWSILPDDTRIEFSDITDETLRGKVIQHIGTPVDLRPYLRTFTVTKLSVRKS